MQTTVTDHFQLSGDYLEDSVGQAMDFEVGPVDTLNPGFASLLTALNQAKQGQLEPGVLEAYYNGLWAHVEDVRARIAAIAIPEGFEAQAEQAFAATNGILDQMTLTLDLLADYLNTGDAGFLEDAIDTLGGVHQEMRAAVNRLR
ncbi:MAG: hypothetical protein AB1758_36750 [Candidatus Eremiobacterota bacterium]